MILSNIAIGKSFKILRKKSFFVRTTVPI